MNERRTKGRLTRDGADVRRVQVMLDEATRISAMMAAQARDARREG